MLTNGDSKGYSDQLPIILIAFLHVGLINVAYLIACLLLGHNDAALFLNNVANDAELTQKSIITS